MPPYQNSHGANVIHSAACSYPQLFSAIILSGPMKGGEVPFHYAPMNMLRNAATMEQLTSAGTDIQTDC